MPQVTGTVITYVPDKKVYGDVFIDLDSLCKMLQELSFFAKGLKIILNVDGDETEFYSTNGLMDGLKHDKPISKPFSFFYETDDCKVELALQWVVAKGKIKGYANGLYMPDGGAFISGFKTSLTKVFNNLCGTKFDGEQIRACLDGYVSVKVRNGQFSNQAKTALANPEARTATSAAITNCLKDFAVKRKDELSKVVAILTKVSKADEAAEKARNAILNHEKESIAASRKKIVHSDKLRDARKLGPDSILLCVEGDSAGGSMSKGRDVDKYGILMLRGKCINALSNNIEDVLENEEVKLLLQALGVTYGKAFAFSKLRYGKIAICTDADSDGSHIGLLIMALLHKLIPGFIESGRLMWLKTPICKVTSGGHNYFYYTEEEYENKNVKGNTIFYKGLGQLSKSDLQQSMFHPTEQRMEQAVYDEDSLVMLEELMGVSAEPRKDFVFNNIDFGEFEHD